jgi:transposase
MKRGEHESAGLYLELYDAVSLAEATAEADCVMQIKKAALTSWFAAAWLLERKWPERWGRREVPPGDETGMDTLVVIG